MPSQLAPAPPEAAQRHPLEVCADAHSRRSGSGVPTARRRGWPGAVIAVLSLAAPLAVRCQSPSAQLVAPAPQHVRTMVGCTPSVLMSATLSVAGGGAAPPVWSRVDDSVGLPRNSREMCAGAYIQVPKTGLQVCGSRDMSISMTPETAQAGHSFSTRVMWERAVDTTKSPQRLPGRPGDGNVAQVVNSSATFVVVAPAPMFETSADEPASYVFHIGCRGTALLVARDTAAPVDLGTSGCSSAQYAVDIKPIAAGSYPATPTGMPQGVAMPEGGIGGVPALVPVEGDMPSSRRMEFQWVPERGQERSTPYRVCFQARDPLGLKHQVKCITVKVQKCMYCAREGDSMASIAAQFDTDWLHLYTTNPLVTNPDELPVGTRINTGVLYEVRKGDYLELLYDRFFVEAEQLLVCACVISVRVHVWSVSICVCVPVCMCLCA